MPSPALITSLPVNALPNKLVANVPNIVGRNPPFYPFVSFLIVSLIPFTSNPDSSNDLTIFIISSLSSFKFINVDVRPDPQVFFRIAASTADIAVDNPNGNKTLFS